MARLLSAVTAEPAPSPDWVAHPDLVQHAPARWFEEAWRSWQDAGQDWPRLHKALRPRGPEEPNAIVAALQHQAFQRAPPAHRAVLADFDLIDPETGAPFRSPFKALSRLLSRHTSEADLIEAARARSGPEATLILRYYLYALNLRLEPTLAFLKVQPQRTSTASLTVIQNEVV